MLLLLLRVVLLLSSLVLLVVFGKWLALVEPVVSGLLLVFGTFLVVLFGGARNWVRGTVVILPLVVYIR